MDNIIDFYKYKEREKVKVYTKVIENIIMQRKNEDKIFYTSDMKKIAEDIINEFNKDGEKVSPVVKIAKSMGFDVYHKKLPKFLSGYIVINTKYTKKYKNEKIIFINRDLNIFQQRFVIAHELAHFLFDYDHNSIKYANTYIKNDHNSESERRANTFAASIILPEKKFREEYIKAININSEPLFVINYLMDFFKAPKKCVIKRIEEVNNYVF